MAKAKKLTVESEPVVEDKNTLTNSAFIHEVYKLLKDNESKLKKEDVRLVIDGVIDTIVENVLNNKKRVFVTGFGIFYPKEIDRTNYRNPRTGEAVKGKPFTKLGFKVNKKLRT